MMPTNSPTGDDWRTILTDPQFDLENHDTPFAPLEDNPGIAAMLHVDEWDCSDIIHEADCETKCYKLQGDEWVYTGTESDRIEHHAISWLGDHSIPGIDGSEQAKIGIEYSDSVIHTDADGDPVERAPGYILFGATGTADGDHVGDITTKTYTNLATAIRDTVQLLTFIRDGMLPAEVSTETPVRDLIEDVTGVSPPN